MRVIDGTAYAGERNGSWKGTEASYVAKHARVRRRRGKASEHECVRCLEDGKHTQAKDWALVHGETGDDPWADYVALCHSCHMIYDGVKPPALSAETYARIHASHRGAKRSAETRAKMSRAHKGVPLSAEHKASLAIAQQARRERERRERDGSAG